ncbi:HDIG domain-containing protein [Verrucomicrobiales bacterium]|jgi:putative nucleotidyltransferase with HDIG domain|nr:HDIG domain-containing protein [Verrucomicrobiales bacterium]
MFHFFAQKRLQSRGFSSGRKRRRPNETAFSAVLRSSFQVCLLLFVVFAALVSGWIILSGNEEALFAGNPMQAVVVVTVITATVMIHWHVSLPQTFRQNSTVTLMLTIIVLQLLLVKLSEHVASTFAPGGGFQFLVEPYIFAPMVLSLLVGRRHGTFAVVYASLFGGMTVARDEAFVFVIFSMICGFVAIYLTDQVRKRSRLVGAGAYAGLACVLLAFTLGQIQWPGFDATPVQWEMVAKQALSAILVSTLTAVVVSGLLPLLEALFRITTDVSWIELADLNHPLLKKMTIEAPGTYHHSLVVATLAETAAEEIGANAIMCRVCSYFHDIGKMNKPVYFVENIGDAPNPHDELTPNMSALIVMAHVKDGVDMAIQYKLNPQIVNVIQEHHGTSLIQFFYHRALKLRDEVQQQFEDGKAHEEDIPEVKEESFRYSGPKPRTRESAIISLADSVESASRSLQKPTPKKIDELIESIFRDRLNDGQLDDAALTLEDLATIKRSFAATLRSMMHTRIEYPKIEEGLEKSKKKSRKSKTKTGEEKKLDSVSPKKSEDTKEEEAAAR